MLVKDQLTGEKADRKTLYKAANGKYYTSQAAYDSMVLQNEYREKCLDEIGRYLLYPAGTRLPSIAYKRLSELKDFGFDIVLSVIRDKSDAINWAMQNKDFASDSSRVMYIFGIIKNYIGDAYRKSKRELPPDKPTALIQEQDLIVSTQKTHDISRFLEDEDD